MDKSTFSILFIMQNGKPNAEGNAPIFARITINHQMTHLATRNIGATKASVLGVFEPITAILVGTLMFGEPLTTNIVVGICIAFVAVTFMISVTKR